VRRLILGFLALLLFSCSEKEPVPDIEMPATPIMTGTISWGVVNVSYLKISREADSDKHIVTTLRQGDVVKIESIRTVNDGREPGTWYQIKKDKISGWVRDRYLNSYSTREKANTASKLLLQDRPSS